MTAPGAEPDPHQLARLLKESGSALDPDGVAALIAGVLAADADIREGAVIERHQLAIGALTLPPSRDRGPRRNKEIDERHGSKLLHLYGALQKMGIPEGKTMRKSADQPCKCQQP